MSADKVYEFMVLLNNNLDLKNYKICFCEGNKDIMIINFTTKLIEITIITED